MKASRGRSEELGQVTVFLVVLLVALFALIGLVYDGGMILAAKRRAGAEADAAARAGAQALDVDAYRRGEAVVLDPAEAEQAVDDYMDAYGDVATADVKGDTIEVTVTIEQPLLFLGGQRVSLTATGRARIAIGERG